MEIEPAFKGEPKEVDTYLEAQFKLRQRIEDINKYSNNILKIYGDKGPKIGFDGEVDFDQVLFDLDSEKTEIEAEIQLNIHKKLGIVLKGF